MKTSILKMALPALLGLASCAGESPPAAAPVTACGDPGTVCTIAGTGERAFNGDGRPAADTAFYWPMDLEFSPDGRPYVLDWNNHRVRRLETDGTFRTVIGTDLPGDGPPDQSDLTPAGALGIDVELNHPTDLQFLPDGLMLVAAWHNHKIRNYDPSSGRVKVICGSGPGNTPMHDLAARALLNQPKSIAVDSKQNIFVADSRNQRIRVISGDVIDSVAGTGRKGYAGDGGPPNLADFYMQESSDNPEPGGSITVDGEGRVYVADTYNHRIRRIDFANGGMVTTIAGNGTQGFGGDGGPATQAALALPRDLELGPDGRLYIADTDNHRIRVVDLTTGIITTFAGNGQSTFAGDGGNLLAASFSRPFGIAFDRDGNLYVADTFNNRIRKVVRP
jgi:sugar lactone lactonase YvrE